MQVLEVRLFVLHFSRNALYRIPPEVYPLISCPTLLPSFPARSFSCTLWLKSKEVYPLKCSFKWSMSVYRMSDKNNLALFCLQPFLTQIKLILHWCSPPNAHMSEALHPCHLSKSTIGVQFLTQLQGIHTSKIFDVFIRTGITSTCYDDVDILVIGHGYIARCKSAAATTTASRFWEMNILAGYRSFIASATATATSTSP